MLRTLPRNYAEDGEQSSQKIAQHPIAGDISGCALSPKNLPQTDVGRSNPGSAHYRSNALGDCHLRDKQRPSSLWERCAVHARLSWDHHSVLTAALVLWRLFHIYMDGCLNLSGILIIFTLPFSPLSDKLQRSCEKPQETLRHSSKHGVPITWNTPTSRCQSGVFFAGGPGQCSRRCAGAGAACLLRSSGPGLLDYRQGLLRRITSLDQTNCEYLKYTHLLFAQNMLKYVEWVFSEQLQMHWSSGLITASNWHF